MKKIVSVNGIKHEPRQNVNGRKKRTKVKGKSLLDFTLNSSR